MRRRDFIRLLSTAAITSASSVGLSQQATKLPKLGYLSDEAPTPHLFHSQDSIVKGLHEPGFDDGRNILIEYRYAAGKAEQLPALASELAALPVDVILAVGTPAARAAQAATKTIPIIFCRIGDPIEYGLVTSLAHPGGNATGVTVFTVALAEKPADLPVIQPAKIDLVINLKTMKALGLTTTPPLLARADEVIE